MNVIANHCPIEGGNAVYEARALLEIIAPGNYYDDDQLCNIQAYQAPINNDQEELNE